MNELEEYHQELMFSLTNRASANDHYIEEIFFDDCLKVLIEDGHSIETEVDIEDPSAGGYNYTPFKSHGYRIDGYEYVQDRGLINLYLCHFKHDKSPQTLTQSEVTKLLSNVKKFFEMSSKEEFHTKFKNENANEAYEVSKFLYDFEEYISQVKVILITNCLLSKSIKSTLVNPQDYFSKLPTQLDVWDINRFFGSEGKIEEVLVEFDQPIPTLLAASDSSKYHSYLCVIPGAVLAALYEKYGARILEANVRSFLQFRGNVNKGIRFTLKNYPNMFFAYNNGITVTAEKCEIDNEGRIISLTNLQIVNGGQTTATLFYASKNGISLDEVFVQTKLSILGDDQDDEVIPNISKFANTQNKINDSDFFSNHPFHRNMEGKSRRISTEVITGNVRSTKWFYERSRGQYQTELGKRTAAQRRLFQDEFPKSQLITKTDLAKTSVIFSGEPNRAVQGLQIAFKYFAVNIQKDWETNENLFNDLLYKKLIAQQIMFNECRLIAMEIASGNAIQPVTAYSLFMLSELSNTTEYSLPFIAVWKKQKAPLVMQNQMAQITKYVNDFLLKRTEEVDGRSILSYSKTKACLKAFNEEIKIINSSQYLINEYRQILTTRANDADDTREANRDEDIANEMEMFIKLSKLNWDEVHTFASASNEIYENDISLLSVFPKFLRGGKEVTRKQQKAIYKILLRMKDEGFNM